jgi:hypothetical protein
LAAGNSDSDHSVAGVVLPPLIQIARATTAADNRQMTPLVKENGNGSYQAARVIKRR